MLVTVNGLAGPVATLDPLPPDATIDDVLTMLSVKLGQPVSIMTLLSGSRKLTPNVVLGSLAPGADTLPLTLLRSERIKIILTGAGQDQSHYNGTYLVKKGHSREKPNFLQANGVGIIYYSDGKWNLGQTLAYPDFFKESDEYLPPCGPWEAPRMNLLAAWQSHNSPSLECVPEEEGDKLTQHPLKHRMRKRIQKGDWVQIVQEDKIHFDEDLVQRPPEAWTPEQRRFCGKKGKVVDVDANINYLLIEFMEEPRDASKKQKRSHVDSLRESSPHDDEVSPHPDDTESEDEGSSSSLEASEDQKTQIWFSGGKCSTCWEWFWNRPHYLPKSWPSRGFRLG